MSPEPLNFDPPRYDYIERSGRRKKNWWCRFGLHRWAYPGGRCEECSEPDALWQEDKGEQT